MQLLLNDAKAIEIKTIYVLRNTLSLDEEDLWVTLARMNFDFTCTSSTWLLSLKHFLELHAKAKEGVRNNLSYSRLLESFYKPSFNFDSVGCIQD